MSAPAHTPSTTDETVSVEARATAVLDRVLPYLGPCLALVVVYVSVVFVQVWLASRRDDARASDVIIVLGAAQFDGRPSQVLKARLDHALDLYNEGIAPTIVVTGGKIPGDRFTEAEASANYLQGLGVPGDRIERETTGASSWESLASASRFLLDQGISRVVLVSDPYHAMRIDGIAHELGLDATVSPADGSSSVGQLLRESVAVAVGRIIGYDRLVRLDVQDGCAGNVDE